MEKRKTCSLMKKVHIALLGALMLLLLSACAAKPQKLVSGDYTYELDRNGNATILSWHGAAESLKIPAALDGHPVKTIGENAFYYCSTLSNVTLPNTVTTLRNHAFYRCDFLLLAFIPSSVTSMGNEAFYNCEEVAIVAPHDSCAAAYAVEHHLNYIYSDSGF